MEQGIVYDRLVPGLPLRINSLPKIFGWVQMPCMNQRAWMRFGYSLDRGLRLRFHMRQESRMLFHSGHSCLSCAVDLVS